MTRARIFAGQWADQTFNNLAIPDWTTGVDMDDEGAKSRWINEVSYKMIQNLRQKHAGEADLIWLASQISSEDKGEFTHHPGFSLDVGGPNRSREHDDMETRFMVPLPMKSNDVFQLEYMMSVMSCVNKSSTDAGNGALFDCKMLDQIKDVCRLTY